MSGDPAPVAVRLPVLEWGLGGRRRALLVHGVSASGAGWWRVASALAEQGVAVTAPDLRGHGGAPAGTRYRLADLAADLVPLGSRWDVVVGHSFGGPVVLELARSGAVHVAALVLVDPFLGADDMAALVVDQVAEVRASRDAARVAADNLRWHPDDAHHKAAAARAVSPGTVERWFTDNAPWDGRVAALAQVAVPTHVVGADPAVGALFTPAQEAVVTANPLVTVERAAGAGHSVHRDDPAPVVAAVLRALGEEA
ncbi:alpha/beta fold hydrolase [Aquipuribacter sp. SD81]|uniref:alpha/beta fold hydrolase n=1 Tax=Aquipuribacter sp. SD81 TaxID=3127703 RepID=UPI003015D700